MADYTIDVNNPLDPTRQRNAKQGSDELRAIKALLASLVIASSASASPRQSIISASLDSNGYNNAISAGAGLRVGLSASASDAYQMSFAVGFSGGKAINSEEEITANIADLTGVDLVASNTNFLYRTFGSSWGSCLVPPQYGYAFDRTQGAILNFEGNDGTVVINDDFGNTWTANGNAQIDTAQFKFGTSSLLLDGTGDFVETTNIISLGDGSWEISCWVRWNALPGAGTEQCIFNFGAATAYGVIVALNNTAGTIKSKIYLSSNGTAADIVNGQLGTNTVWAAGTWYKFRMVFDALGGSYKLYLSVAGAAETADNSFNSFVRINAATSFRYGAQTNNANYLNGWMDACRLIRCATKTSAETPAVSAPTITDYPIHFFNIPKMRMYEVTAAASGAGQNPTLTAITRLFVGEANTGAATVTAVRNYAVRGEYDTGWFDVTAPANPTKDHNLGVPLPWHTTQHFFSRSPFNQEANSTQAHDFEVDSVGVGNGPLIHGNTVGSSANNRISITPNFSTNVQRGGLGGSSMTSGRWRMLVKRNF